MDRLLFLDTETGGLDSRTHSLLSLGLVVWDKNDGIIYKREVCQKLKRYSVTQEALDVNHFDISLYSPSDILTASQIHELFLSIADEYFPTMKRLPLAGHNIQFDSAFLKEMYFKNKLPYDKTFATRMVDTFSLLQFLIHLDLIPAEINYSTVAFDYFNIKVKGRHTALGDSVATAELYTQLLNLIKSKLK